LAAPSGIIEWERGQPIIAERHRQTSAVLFTAPLFPATFVGYYDRFDEPTPTSAEREDLFLFTVWRGERVRPEDV
jgi:hypothetical protein